MDKVITIGYDDQPECPMSDDGQWTLVSFSRRSVHHKDRENYLRVTAEGEVVPATVGLASKFRAGLAFVLDYYEHGCGAYSLRGEGAQCRWDTARHAGVLLWLHPPGDMGAKKYADRARDAKAFLEEYNAWMNGHVYFYSIEPADPTASTADWSDACGGFYETEYLSQQIAHSLEAGDRVVVRGDCADAFDARKLPAGVELLETLPMPQQYYFPPTPVGSPS